MLKFSVIIPTYNRSAMLLDAVNSVLNQTYKEYEIIVVDDGSTDDTKEIARNLSNGIVFHQQNNSGVSSARNKGIDLATGDYICYLDSDDLWPENKLEIYSQILSGQNDIKFLFSDFQKHDLKLPNPYRETNSDIFSYIYEHFDRIGTNVHKSDGTRLQSFLMRGYPLYPSTFAVRKDVHTNFRWDPNVLKSEDFNFVLKLTKKFPFHYVDLSLATIRVHETNKSADFRTKNHVNLMTMKLYRDLYLAKGEKGLANYYISAKLFSDGKTYIKKSLYIEGLKSILSSFAYKENWLRILNKLLGKRNNFNV